MQIRVHDPALVNIVCHHGRSQGGHVRYCERWNIGDTGAARIATAVAGTGNSLGPNPHIKSIYLQGNGITSVGVKAIIDGLKNCHQVSELNLQGNEIGKEGAFTIGSAVKEGLAPTICF